MPANPTYFASKIPTFDDWSVLRLEDRNNVRVLCSGATYGTATAIANALQALVTTGPEPVLQIDDTHVLGEPRKD